LKKLEKTYQQELVVLGVHSAKFDTEKITDSIRQAVLRHDIQHPVVNDAEMTIWRNYAIRSWPTLVLIDPEGYVVGAVQGEGQFGPLEEAIKATIATHRARGTLDETPKRFKPEAQPDTPLRFPGKIAATLDPPRLYISDTGNHRIIASDLEGTVLWTVGTGTPGWTDGAGSGAQFREPQGLFAHGNTLWVADTENHAIRAIDLTTRAVSTIAGIGTQVYLPTGGAGRTTGLNSPWDVVFDPKRNALFIAIAGQHQIWAYDFKSQAVAPFAGDRAERLKDGSLSSASFNQPSGLSLAGDMLYVADSEVSGVRAIDLKTKRVRTLTGTGLFDWGDVDGVGTAAKLQHVLHVTASADGTLLFIADAYNDKVKVMNLATAAITTLAGDGTHGATDTPARFYEPAGLAVAGAKLYVADTNNHAIRVVDLADGSVTTLSLTGVPAAGR
jgi:DNA-binding beta-propeller fold protein YncE